MSGGPLGGATLPRDTGTVTTDYLPLEAMNDGQRQKRRQILDATLHLLESRHPAEVSVRDVAVASGIALATIYRFFRSKDHLLASAMLHWEGRLAEWDGPVEAENAEDRLISVVRRGTRAYLGKPHMLALMIMVATTRDPYALEIGAELRLQIRSILLRQLEEFGESDAVLLTEIVQATWLDMLIHWYAGRRSMTDGLDQIERAVRVATAGMRADR